VPTRVPIKHLSAHLSAPSWLVFFSRGGEELIIIWGWVDETPYYYFLLLSGAFKCWAGVCGFAGLLVSHFPHDPPFSSWSALFLLILPFPPGAPSNVGLACAGLRVCWFAGLLGNILHINTILFHGYYVNAADAEVGWGVGR
jgi:hypothetical protein